MNGLYKYFPVDLYKVEALARQRILLTPPKYFNDPWDFRVRREPITDDEMRTQFQKFQSERPSSVSFDEFKASITRPEFVEREGPDMQDSLSKIIGVVSLTSDPYNRLMWAYYADSHRGFVAEFAHGPTKESHGVEAALSPFGPAVRVTYAPNLQTFRADFSNVFEVYFIKHETWEHEAEWRVVEYLAAAVSEPKDEKIFHLLGFKPENLLRLILGLRVDPDVERRLSEMLDTKEFAHVKKEVMKIDSSSGELACSACETNAIADKSRTKT
jgi:hypothetical protein